MSFRRRSPLSPLNIKKKHSRRQIQMWKHSKQVKLAAVISIGPRAEGRTKRTPNSCLRCYVDAAVPEWFKRLCRAKPSVAAAHSSVVVSGMPFGAEMGNGIFKVGIAVSSDKITGLIENQVRHRPKPAGGGSPLLKCCKVRLPPIEGPATFKGSTPLRPASRPIYHVSNMQQARQAEPEDDAFTLQHRLNYWIQY